MKPPTIHHWLVSSSRPWDTLETEDEIRIWFQVYAARFEKSEDVKEAVRVADAAVCELRQSCRDLAWELGQATSGGGQGR